LTLGQKRRAVHVALVLFTLWPLGHMYLVVRFDLSAWKLAGWGMYATPRPSFSGIAVFGRRPGSQQFEEVRTAPTYWQTQASEFVARQRWLGQLIRPSQLARAFKAYAPEFADLRIVVYMPALDRRTGMIVVKEFPYDYPGTQLGR
jgi:hypothetical protein